MRTVSIHLHARGTEPAAAYERISDFARYPSMVDTVREVVVAEPDSDGSIRSQWTVRFRSGLLQWTERDVLDAAERTITFTSAAKASLQATGRTHRGKLSLGRPRAADPREGAGWRRAGWPRPRPDRRTRRHR